MLKIFQLYPAECPTPVTICAGTIEEADECFHDWAERNRPKWTEGLVLSRELDLQAPFEDPSILTARDAAERMGLSCAILGYDDNARIWRHFCVDAPFTVLLAPPWDRVHAYQFDVPLGDAWRPDALVFAHDITHAMQIYFDWRESVRHGVDALYRATSVTKSQLRGNREELIVLMEQGQTGVAQWGRDKGWSIVAPESLDQND